MTPQPETIYRATAIAGEIVLLPGELVEFFGRSPATVRRRLGQPSGGASDAMAMPFLCRHLKQRAPLIPREADYGKVGYAESRLSVKEIAVHLGVNPDTIYGWISRKRMPAHKVGKLWKFMATEVNQWVKGGEAAQKAKGRGAAPSDVKNSKDGKQSKYER